MQGKDKRNEGWIIAEVLPHEPLARAWLARTLGDPAAVDDISQEAYCRIAALETVSHIEHGGAYLLATVRSIIWQCARRARTAPFDRGVDAEQVENVEAEYPSPERVVASRRELARVLALIADMPSGYQNVIALRRLHGCSQKETAHILGVSEAVVENRSLRGMQMIRKAREQAA